MSTGVYSRGSLVVSRGATFTNDRVRDLDEFAAVLVADDGPDVVYMFGESPVLSGAEVTGGGVDGEPVWRVRWHGRSLVFVEDDVQGQAGPWLGLSAPQLVAAFRNFERLVGVPWGDSIGRTAESLILSTHPRARGGRLLDREPVIPPPAEAGNLELPYVWSRPLTDAERATGDGGHVHTYDANAQYLGAWQTVELPHGVPVHHPGGALFDPGVAGLWRVLPAALPTLDSMVPGLPVPWSDPGRQWFTTPTVTRMAELAGEPPAVTEAWCWPERSRFLRSAAERLRDARQAAAVRSVAARAAYLAADVDVDQADQELTAAIVADAVVDAVKALYRVQTGRFNMSARSERSGFHRPEWGHFVRAQARVNMHRKLANLRAKPFAIATDALAFVAAEPDPLVFAEWLGLPIGLGLGQYKVQGTRAAALTYLDASPARIFEQVAGR